MLAKNRLAGGLRLAGVLSQAGAAGGGGIGHFGRYPLWHQTPRWRIQWGSPASALALGPGEINFFGATTRARIRCLKPPSSGLWPAACIPLIPRTPTALAGLTAAVRPFWAALRRPYRRRSATSCWWLPSSPPSPGDWGAAAMTGLLRLRNGAWPVELIWCSCTGARLVTPPGRRTPCLRVWLIWCSRGRWRPLAFQIWDRVACGRCTGAWPSGECRSAAFRCSYPCWHPIRSSRAVWLRSAVSWVSV